MLSDDYIDDIAVKKNKQISHNQITAQTRNRRFQLIIQ